MSHSNTSCFPHIRFASPVDALRLLEIYRPYVEQTAVTFELETPSLQEFERRISDTTRRYPYLVYEKGDCLWGYAYASAFKGRAAYSHTIETSIYLSPEARHKGIGRQLYKALEKCLQAQSVLNACACISYAKEETPYLTHESKRFHTRMGYRQVARFHRCGFKNGRWWDIIWMEKYLGRHSLHPQPFRPFPEVRSLFQP